MYIYLNQVQSRREMLSHVTGELYKAKDVLVRLDGET